MRSKIKRRNALQSDISGDSGCAAGERFCHKQTIRKLRLVTNFGLFLKNLENLGELRGIEMYYRKLCSDG
jgi:hypothetical protein